MPAIFTNQHKVREQHQLGEGAAPRSWMQRWGRSASNAEDRQRNAVVPRVNVMDHGYEIVVHAELPGIDKENIDVFVTEYAVTIRGCTKHAENGNEASDYRYDLANGCFVRTVGLLSSVDAQKASVTFKAGVLDVILPITNKIQRRHIKLT